MKELNILYLYPDILELYGDFGNIQVLKYRLEKRGIKANITPYSIGDDTPDFNKFDLVFSGYLLFIILFINSLFSSVILDKISSFVFGSPSS